MKKLLLAPLVLLSLNTFSQAVYTVGVPVNDSLNTFGASDGSGCFPNPTFEVSVETGAFPYATGVTLAFKIIAISGQPPSTAPFGVLQVGDTLPLPGPHPSGGYEFFHPTGMGSVNFNLIAYGTPTTVGQNYVCAWNTILATLALCNNGIIFLHDSVCNVQPIVGIANNVANSGISIFPNPSSGAFTIEMDNGQLSIDNYQLSIYDLLGELVFSSEPLPIAIGTTNYELDLRSKAKGIYFITVTTDDKTVTQKLIIN